MQEIYSLKIFNGIDKNIIDLIIKNSSIEKFNPGEVILSKGEKSNGKGYIIKSGEVEVSINGNIIAKLKTGEIFGEIALLNEEERTANVKAITEVETIVLSQESLLEIVDSGNDRINKDIMNRIEENLYNN